MVAPVAVQQGEMTGIASQSVVKQQTARTNTVASRMSESVGAVAGAGPVACPRPVSRTMTASGAVTPGSARKKRTTRTSPVNVIGAGVATAAGAAPAFVREP